MYCLLTCSCLEAEILAHIIENLQLVGIKAQIDVYKMEETDIYVFWKETPLQCYFSFRLNESINFLCVFVLWLICYSKDVVY